MTHGMFLFVGFICMRDGPSHLLENSEQNYDNSALWNEFGNKFRNSSISLTRKKGHYHSKLEKKPKNQNFKI